MFRCSNSQQQRIQFNIAFRKKGEAARRWARYQGAESIAEARALGATPKVRVAIIYLVYSSLP